MGPDYELEEDEALVTSCEFCTLFRECVIPEEDCIHLNKSSEIGNGKLILPEPENESTEV